MTEASDLFIPMYSRDDLNQARIEAREEGRKVGRAQSAAAQVRWGWFGGFAITLVIAGLIGYLTWLNLSTPEEAEYRWVEIDGQRCVEVPHPDFSATSVLVPAFIVLCNQETITQ